jgi:uncharacterized protein YdcH (DUF465 family)
MSHSEPSGGRRSRAAKIALANLLLLVVVAVAVLLFLRHHQRSPGATGGAVVEPLSPVEAAQRDTQAWVTERMKDPEYREQLRAIDESRRVLATQANALEAEVVAWQQKLAAENAEFSALLAKLEALRSQTDAGTTETAVAEVKQAIQALMEQDPRGSELLARQNTLNTQRDALQQEALRTVGLRMQRQQAKQFGQTVANPAHTGDEQ